MICFAHLRMRINSNALLSRIPGAPIVTLVKDELLEIPLGHPNAKVPTNRIVFEWEKYFHCYVPMHKRMNFIQFNWSVSHLKKWFRESAMDRPWILFIEMCMRLKRRDIQPRDGARVIANKTNEQLVAV